MFVAKYLVNKGWMGEKEKEEKKLWQNLKAQIVTKLKNSNCDKTQNKIYCDKT